MSTQFLCLFVAITYKKNASLAAVLTGTMFIDMKINKIIMRNTPIERIDDYVFFGVNETLRELELIDTMLSTFPTAIKVNY